MSAERGADLGGVPKGLGEPRGSTGGAPPSQLESPGGLSGLEARPAGRHAPPLPRRACPYKVSARPSSGLGRLSSPASVRCALGPARQGHPSRAAPPSAFLPASTAPEPAGRCTCAPPFQLHRRGSLRSQPAGVGPETSGRRRVAQDGVGVGGKLPLFGTSPPPSPLVRATCQTVTSTSTKLIAQPTCVVWLS